MTGSVGAAGCDSYDLTLLGKAIAHAARAVGEPSVAGKTILLKPNLLSAEPPERAVTTHPEFVRAVIQYLFALGAKTIYVGDSPGVAKAEKAAEVSGIMAVINEEGAVWADFSRFESYENPAGRVQRRFDLPSLLKEVDMVISLPKCKTHAMLYFTGAIKNLFGLINGLEKSRFHFRYGDKDTFSRMIIDLITCVKPAYAFMDGVVSMEGQGPGNGTPYPLGMVLAGPDLFVMDEAAAELIGYKAKNLPLMLAAEEAGLGVIGAGKVVGFDLESIKPKRYALIAKEIDIGFIKKALPPPIYKIFKNLYVKRPFFSKKRCIACARCVKICPPKALTMAKPPRINYDVCIRCYCCHEVCPVEAIQLARFLPGI